MSVPLPASPRSPRHCIAAAAAAAAAAAGTTENAPPPAPAPTSTQQQRNRRAKRLPPQIALDGAVNDSDNELQRHHHVVGFRSLTLGIMALTLRGKHRRPATNPTPTAWHPILLNNGSDASVSASSAAAAAASSPEGLSRSEGQPASAAVADDEAVLLEAAAAAAAAATVVSGSSKKGLAATVAGTTGARNGRRPRPLAISAVDAHQFNVSTILPGRLLIGGEDVGGSVATLRRLGVQGVVNATRDGVEEAKQEVVAEGACACV
jgi:hypothetical protein